MTDRDKIKHLQWIYARMVNVHGEKHNMDYMIKFEQIIKGVKMSECEKTFLRFRSLMKSDDWEWMHDDMRLEYAIKTMADMFKEHNEEIVEKTKTINRLMRRSEDDR